jgi:tetratricopeptide (TPR) repeat protein
MVSVDQKKNDVKGMVEHLERVHQVVPTWVDPAVSLAAADLYLKRFEEAKSIALPIYEAHPEFAGVHLILAASEMGLGEFRNAERDYVELALHEKHPGGFYNLASGAAEKAGDSGHAVEYLDLAYKSSPNDPAILNNMAFSLADRRTDLPRALLYAKKALEKAPQPFAQDTVGYVLYRMGQFKRAENHFTQAYKANFRDPEFLFHMGLNERKLGMKEKSENLLQKALNSGKLSKKEQEEAHEALGEIPKT